MSELKAGLLQPHKSTENELETSTMIPRGNKFLRRHDLTPSIRLYIAFMAISARATREWGKITELSRQFMISRMFVYMLANTLHETSLAVFGENVPTPAVAKELTYRYMLSLRLEGKCSIGTISTIMKRFGIAIAAQGSISEYLKRFGSLLPNTLENSDDEVKLVVFLADELFAKKIPILVTVDPISSVILRIEIADSRKVKDWENHWECIQKNGFTATYLVTDEGKGLTGAHKEALADIIRQPDTYHAIAHQLGQWVDRLETSAYSAIQKEFDCYDTLDSARSDEVINKRIDAYEEAVKLQYRLAWLLLRDTFRLTYA